MNDAPKPSAWTLLGEVLVRLFWLAVVAVVARFAVAYGYSRLVAEAIALIVATVAHARQENRLRECEMAVTDLQSDLQKLSARLAHLENTRSNPDP